MTTLTTERTRLREKVQTFTDQAQLKLLLKNKSHKSVIFEVLSERLHEIARADAQDAAITTTLEAKERYHFAPEGSAAQAMLGEIWNKLANEEAPLLASKCTLPEEANDLMRAAPFGGVARAIYSNKENELHDLYAPARAASCTTTHEVRRLISATQCNTKAWHTYRERLFVLTREELGACTTSQDVKNLIGKCGDRNIADPILRERLAELIDAEAPERASSCGTAEEAGAKYIHAPEGSLAKKIYEARWIELYILEL